MKHEEYTPREQDVLTESRKIADAKKLEEGAQEKGERVEFAGEQVAKAREEMEESMKRGKQDPVEQALMIKSDKLNQELLPVWSGMRELNDKLPLEVGKALADIHGKYYFSGNEGELRKLEDQRAYLKMVEETSPEKVSPEFKRYSELINDPRLEEYWRTKMEKDAVKSPEK